MDVLAELGAQEKRILTVFNKIDLLPGDGALNPLRRHFPDALFISTRTGAGLDDLLARMADQLAGRTERVELLLPPDRGDLLGSLHRQGQVLSAEYTDEGTRVQAVVPLKLLAGLAPFRRETPAVAVAGVPTAPPVLDSV